jgi:LacI family kdg operon repressor
MAPEDRHITINDIASAAGVSKTTVSRYINGRYNMMSEPTRKRIEEVIRLTSYRPSSFARGLKTHKSYLVGVAISDISSPFMSSAISGITDVLSENGYLPICVNCEDSYERETSALKSLSACNVDGLIVNTTREDNPFLVSLATTGLPVVLLDRKVRNYNLDIVTGDYARAVHELIRHLHDVGYAHVSLLTQEFQSNSVRKGRVEAFEQACKELYGADTPEQDVYVINLDDIPQVTAALESSIKAAADGVPAVMGINSVTTMDIIYAAERMGVCSPNQLGICGPDDLDWLHDLSWDLSEIMGGGLTTYKVHPYRAGSETAKLLLHRIRHPDGTRKNVVLPAEISVRNSTNLAGTVAQQG